MSGSLVRAAAVGWLIAALGACAGGAPAPPTPAPTFAKINHVIVLYLENRSFDNLYGDYPGASGLLEASTGRTTQQRDATGALYDSLPQVPGSPFPGNLPNAPFDITKYVPPNVPTIDLVHRFYQEQMQIDGGRMDRFAAVSDAKGLTMGYYPTSGLPLATEARKYTVADRFFHGAFGGSFLNHIYLISAAIPVWSRAPRSMIAQIDDKTGLLIRDGVVTPDGYVVNTAYSVNKPFAPWSKPAERIPNQNMPTIGDRLSEKKISWAWYAGGWNDAMVGNADSSFQYHHQPFAYFSAYADGTPAKTAHLKDERDFLVAARSGTLPAVSFVKPIGTNNEHPGYADIVTGERHVMELIDAVRSGANWKDAAIIITYDENGGFWDHVPPPKIDRWGPGTRIPAIIISPFAKVGFVDHTIYDTTSILALIEHRWGLAPLSDRDARAADMRNAFQ